VQLYANVAAWSTILVRAVQKALTHAKLGHEIVALLLLAATHLGVLNRPLLAVDHDIIVDVHFLRPPVDSRDEHDESRMDVPFPRAQESQQERIRVIVLDHAPEGLPQLLGLLRSESLLELLRLTVLVIATLSSAASIVLVLAAEQLHSFRLGLLALGRGVRCSGCGGRGGSARMCAFGCYAKDFESLRPHLLQLQLLLGREVARPSGRHLSCHYVWILLRLEREGVVLVVGCADWRGFDWYIFFGVSVYDKCCGGGETECEDKSKGLDGGALWSREWSSKGMARV
jgi:hypothetical protein